MNATEKKMLDFVTESIEAGGVGDPRAAKGLLVLPLKYLCENAGVPATSVPDALEELDRDGKICLFALPEADLDNVVIQLPIPG